MRIAFDEVIRQPNITRSVYNIGRGLIVSTGTRVIAMSSLVIE
jgi:hypothetical protein